MFLHIQALTMKKLRCKYYNNQITTREIGNVRFHDQEESKLNSNTNANSATHALTDNKIIKSLFNKNNVDK